jgi:hypothetical protein
MSGTFHTIERDIENINRLCSDVKQTSYSVTEILASISEALKIIDGVDDPVAQAAVADMHSAETELKQAITGWLPNYQNSARELIYRVSS